MDTGLKRRPLGFFVDQAADQVIPPSVLRSGSRFPAQGQSSADDSEYGSYEEASQAEKAENEEDQYDGPQDVCSAGRVFNIKAPTITTIPATSPTRESPPMKPSGIPRPPIIP